LKKLWIDHLAILTIYDQALFTYIINEFHFFIKPFHLYWAFTSFYLSQFVPFKYPKHPFSQRHNNSCIALKKLTICLLLQCSFHFCQLVQTWSKRFADLKLIITPNKLLTEFANIHWKCYKNLRNLLKFLTKLHLEKTLSTKNSFSQFFIKSRFLTFWLKDKN
jgi:hypothetical protein